MVLGAARPPAGAAHGDGAERIFGSPSCTSSSSLWDSTEPPPRKPNPQCGIEAVQTLRQPAEDLERIHTISPSHRLRVYTSPNHNSDEQEVPGRHRSCHALAEPHQQFEYESRHRTGYNPRVGASCTISLATFCSPLALQGGFQAEPSDPNGRVVATALRVDW